MIAVLFEVMPTDEGRDRYLEIAALLKEKLETIEGFISIERFQSLADKRRLLSLSFWENEEAIKFWREFPLHQQAQQEGMSCLFSDYRIRVAYVQRDYSKQGLG